jgi:hypothetical protein
MAQIAAPAHITADESKRAITFTPPSFFAKVRRFLISTIFRKRDDDFAKRYEGTSWCDQTEHDLNYDVMTGRRTRRS